MKRAVYAALVLLVVSYMLAGFNLLWSAHLANQARQQATQQNRATQQALCTLLVPATTPRIARPADPKSAPAREAQFEWQQRYLALSAKFGC